MTRERMIEVMARAAYERRNGKGFLPWSKQDKLHKNEYRADATAALTALEAAGVRLVPAEPTHLRDFCGLCGGHGCDCKSLFDRAMIAAIDAESKKGS